MLNSGDESDAMDNIVFSRPITRRMSKGKETASTPVASSSTTPTRRRSLRKSTGSAAKITRARSSRRISHTTSTPSSSPSQPPSQSHSESYSQSDPHAVCNDSTGMSQDLARVCVASQVKPNTENTEPRSDDPVSQSESASAIIKFDVAGEEQDLDVKPIAVRGSTSASVFVFDTNPESTSQPQPNRELKPGTAARTPLALPVFAVTSPLPGDEPLDEHMTTSQVSMAVSNDTNDMNAPLPPPPNLDDTFDSTYSSSVTFDLSIPASLSSASSNSAFLPAPPRVKNALRRSARLSGISATSTVSSTSSNFDINSTSRPVKPRANPKATSPIVPSTTSSHAMRKPSVKAKSQVQAPPTDDLMDHGPTGSGHNAQPSVSLLDSTLVTAVNKGKEKAQRSPSPPIFLSVPPPTMSQRKLRSLSPDSEAVLTSLHQSLLPSARPPTKSLAKSSDRPVALPSAMKRRNDDPEPNSPTKRARFDPDPPPIPSPPHSQPAESSQPAQSQPSQPSRPSQYSQPAQSSQPSRSLPGRIRVHPANSSFIKSTNGNSFLGSHPPIVVRGQNSPSRQQLLVHRPAGPPMRVPVGQQQQQQQPQRATFPSRVASPVRSGPTSESPSKPQRNDTRNAWGAHVTSKKTQIKPPEVLIAPTSDKSSSPVRTARPLSRLPVPAGRKAKEKAEPEVDADENESPPATTGSSMPMTDGAMSSTDSTSTTLDVANSIPRERTPPTPLETPASPGSSTSTLIMDVPLFYQPPAPRHAPIQSKTAEEIIAEGTAREAQRKQQGKTKAAAAGAAAMRCLPLTRAPKRIIPDGSALQAWASVSHVAGPLTEGQKELQKLTMKNTRQNNTYECVVVERAETYVDRPRPTSPGSRVPTKAQKARVLERQSRDERAQRRSAARDGEGDSSLTSTGVEERRLAPGDDVEWVEPVRKGRHVRWAQTLAHDDVDKGPRTPETSAAVSVGRGCLARTYELDRHGNSVNPAPGPAPTLKPLRVVITRYVYNDQSEFKVWKRGQT
ncbi:Proteoglycan 4 [Rhizoctonia solani]|uniref:Proteoglycan 4 n=1 Tax=Rhizoctonia solani TaxID=456999 RepID=A0A0K6FT94_9AGAM|nr:Proteoglycan 4 [Rhizoctonia solani]